MGQGSRGRSLIVKNYNPEIKSIKKQRVLFSDGSVEIKSVTANSLQMEFKGTGHALMDKKKFPITYVGQSAIK